MRGYGRWRRRHGRRWDTLGVAAAGARMEGVPVRLLLVSKARVRGRDAEADGDYIIGGSDSRSEIG